MHIKIALLHKNLIVFFFTINPSVIPYTLTSNLLLSFLWSYTYTWKQPPPTNSLSREFIGIFSLPIPTK